MFHYQSSHDTKPRVAVKMSQKSDLGLDYICPIFLLCHISNPHTFHSMPYDMIYLLTAIGLSPGGSTHLHTNTT
jgi:hypothetical protein